MTDTHRHEWEIWVYDKKFPKYVGRCNHCDDTMEYTEVESRLNAVEYLSAELIREELGMHEDGWTGWDAVREAAWQYADALEGKDDEDRES